MTIIRQPSCSDPSDPDLLPVEIAVSRIMASLVPLTEIETVNLRQALDRVLGEDQPSPIDVPSYRNSAMDGYAIHSSDIPAGDTQNASRAENSNEKTLTVIGTSWAGQPFAGSLSPGEAVRIMTGGMMPDNADTVVIQEHVAVTDDTITIDSTVEAYRNVRQAGEDVACGEIVLKRGDTIDPARLGLLASLGISRVPVIRKLKVAWFTTGDELRELDEPYTPGGVETQTASPVTANTLKNETPNTDTNKPIAANTTAADTVALGPGELYDSNRYTLFGMLSRLNVELIDLGVVRDDEAATRAAFDKASSVADVVITSGGVSAGDADFVTRVFHDMGTVAFWKLAMRPGRPLAFGDINGKAFFGLPGNPVAVMVTFYEFVQPAIRHLSGATDIASPRITATCLSALRKSIGRTEYQRGVMGIDESGALTVSSTGKQGAGRLSSMVAADCMIVLPPGTDRVSPGDRVDVQPFHGLTLGV